MAFVNNRTLQSTVFQSNRTIQGTVSVTELYRVQHLLVKELYRVWYLLVKAIHYSHIQQQSINILSLFFQFTTCFSTNMLSQCYLQTIRSEIHLSYGNIKKKNKMKSKTILYVINSMLETVCSSFISASGAVTKLCSQKTYWYPNLCHFTPLSM